MTTLVKKSNSYRHCKNVTKYDFLNWENMIEFADILPVYKFFMAWPLSPLNEFITQNQNSSSRATTREDYKIPHRKSTFG